MSRRGWILFAAMCVIWGIPYLLIKVGVGALTPASLVLVRTGLAAVLLLPVAAVRPSSGSAVRSPVCWSRRYRWSGR